MSSVGHVLAGPALWACHFLAIYTSESLLCRAGLPGAHDALVTAATFAALLVLAWHGVALRRWRTSHDVQRGLAPIAIGLDALSALAIVFAAMAAALPACS
ncbi:MULTISPECIES: hypothetical protein [unclassified Chelatococcus]|uniref:hypothetical protein n=1 Tax=unclassified Chelatococcus TaxID=2638111 RepID=UPI001BCD4554|nr:MULTISPECIES: hypothetical protein [unclassified Chelatococcus]MBS7699934.1 hypothetical protein [Chelatococcus sp. YT9]MBX3558641.1 hypothetical protein [Chelatococcus sp.]